ncbi:TPA: hypothetical protein OTS77_005074, partial [Escherichia coli]|nr:hypothetical protein [Escherichia coli]
MNADTERYFSDLIEAKKFNGYTLVSGEDWQGNDSNLLIVFYVQIMPDDFV